MYIYIYTLNCNICKEIRTTRSVSEEREDTAHSVSQLRSLGLVENIELCTQTVIIIIIIIITIIIVYYYYYDYYHCYYYCCY